MTALGLIGAPQKVSEDYTQGFRQQSIDGAPSSSNSDVEYWKSDAAYRVANMIESAQALANSIATRDYFMAGPTVEDLGEQLAAVKSKIDASVPGDRNYGNLWVHAVTLQERIEAAEEAVNERDPAGLPRTGEREDVTLVTPEGADKAMLRTLRAKADSAI